MERGGGDGEREVMGEVEVMRGSDGEGEVMERGQERFSEQSKCGTYIDSG